jgi:hypothetical protein
MPRHEESPGVSAERSRRADSLGDLIEGTGIAFGVGAAVVGIAVPPAGVALGVASGTAAAVNLVRRRLRARAELIGEGVRERAGLTQIEARVTTDEAAACLVAQALGASMLAQHDEQATALGRLIGDALRSPPVITLDEATLIVDALGTLDLVHFQVLRSLSAAGPAGRRLSEIGALIEDSTDLSPVVATALQRVGAVNVRAHLVEEPVGSGLYQLEASDLLCAVTAFGVRLLGYVQPSTVP